ncbi:MAG: penicillin-binding protein 2 [Acidobacteria bacterium]|nr:penicillin-binding protein 2 [Acidobacteriota bacterium]
MMSIPPPSRDVLRARLLLALLQHCVVVIFAALLVSFWHVQIGQHEHFLAMAENNHQRRLSLRAPRGAVLDRDGEVLVENRHSLNISLVREQVEDIDAWIARLARTTGTDEAAIADIVERQPRASASRPVVVIRDASLSQVAAVAARKPELPGLVVEQVPTRRYPGATFGAHALGYVGEVTDVQLSLPDFEGLRSGAIVGHAGIEYAYNDRLMGTDGSRHVIVNSVGREIETVREVAPVEGAPLELTIDYDLQRAAEEGFQAAGFDGAAVVLDPRSGEVLALVSRPAYDPNVFATGIDAAAWGELLADPLNPLQNRALRGRYSPGSTFKIVMAIAALEEGVVDPHDEIVCRGGGVFYRRFFACHSTHGSVDMARALAQSCNTYFYRLGQSLGIDLIHKWATALGLGRMSGIDLPHEVQGLIPSREWKRATRGERWYAGETISVAIGQGQVSVTPLSMAVMMAAVANGGRVPTPRVLRSAFDGRAGRRDVEEVRAAAVPQLAPETLATVRRGLWTAVNGVGTARRARVPGRDVIGKTGTAQVVSLSGRRAATGSEANLRDHGWFVFAAPRDDARIAGVVFAEHGEHGYLAAEISRHVIETFFAKEEGLPLPASPLPARPPVTTVADAAHPEAASGGQ